MRLQDWQKFIESQFLEDEPVAPSPPPAAKPPETIRNGIEKAETQAFSEAVVHVPGKPDGARAAGAPFRPPPNTDLDTPAFERYRPSHNVTPYRPPAEDSRADTGPTPVPTPDSKRREASRSRRSPQHRARHVRDVRPEPVPSGLSAAELWATVPRHVQTLLSLGRIAEPEIAQFSYKRPFREERHELIARLLDPILSLEDTARLLNVCPTTVRRYTNRGLLTHYRKEPDRSSRCPDGGEKETRQRRFRLSDILAFLEAQQAAVEADRAREQVRGSTTAERQGSESEPSTAGR